MLVKGIVNVDYQTVNFIFKKKCTQCSSRNKFYILPYL